MDYIYYLLRHHSLYEYAVLCLLFITAMITAPICHIHGERRSLLSLPEASCTFQHGWEYAGSCPEMCGRKDA